MKPGVVKPGGVKPGGWRVFTVMLCFVQDGRAEVVANDAGDRVTPAVVAYRDTEQVTYN